jgi:coenzyme F420-reducing hydrogenase beta subunit
MLIQLKDTSNKKIKRLLFPYPEYWNGSGSFFLHHRCTLCADGFNRLTDVSCGDAWLSEYQSDNLGTSLIMTRTKIGEQLVTRASEKGRIEVRKIEFSYCMHTTMEKKRLASIVLTENLILVLQIDLEF